MNFVRRCIDWLLWKPKIYIATQCGHQTELGGEITAFDETIKVRLPKKDDESVEWCLGCIKQMIIQCAWCGGSIGPGEPITLYALADGHPAPANAVTCGDNPVQYVGCLRWGCAETGADRAGFWVPGDNGNGRVQPVLTAFEVLAGKQVPDIVVIHNQNDFNEAEQM